MQYVAPGACSLRRVSGTFSRRPVGSAAERRAREGDRLLNAVPDGALLVALDEGGRALKSRDFADQIGKWLDAGQRSLAFAIGGADGLAPAVIERARLVLSLGPMTWPHMLARCLLVEQLYRAQQIRAGHPYHKG